MTHDHIPLTRPTQTPEVLAYLAGIRTDISRPVETTAERIAAAAQDPGAGARVLELEADLERTRSSLAGVAQDRDRLRTLWRRLTTVAADAERALIRAGYEHPTGRIAALIDQLASDRDEALALADMRAEVIARHAAEATAAGRVIDAVRTGTLEQIERAMAAYDAPGRSAAPVPAPAREQEPPPATLPPAYHWGRAWSPTQDEATCPCPKVPCGYVIRSADSADCEHHGPAQTMRGGHTAGRCPGKPA